MTVKTQQASGFMCVCFFFKPSCALHLKCAAYFTWDYAAAKCEFRG